MGQWSLKERLQPSLLDRLTDLQPSKSRESSSMQSMSQSEFKAAVIRDLGWLLNCTALNVSGELDDYPDTKGSVINYGLPDLSGHTSSTIDNRTVEKSVKKAIHDFEPRIIRHSLVVRIRSDNNQMSHNSMVFEIEGAVFGQPSPFQVVLKSELDLECGEFKVTEDFG